MHGWRPICGVDIGTEKSGSKTVIARTHIGTNDIIEGLPRKRVCSRTKQTSQQSHVDSLLGQYASYTSAAQAGILEVLRKEFKGAFQLEANGELQVRSSYSLIASPLRDAMPYSSMLGQIQRSEKLHSNSFRTLDRCRSIDFLKGFPSQLAKAETPTMRELPKNSLKHLISIL
jgi:hypothetical protein